ncbi:N1R/p28-like protein [Cheloniid poxvirus 1]|nr:N1R/p28-like protein [Cheloniid poxvirus 1]
MLKENGFINATKLCNLGNKKFRNWRKLQSSKDLIRIISFSNNVWNIKSPGSDLSRVILEVGTESKGKHQYEVAGSYVIRILFLISLLGFLHCLR